MCIRDSQYSVEKLQLAVHKLHVLSKKYNLKLCVKKTKVMVFKGFPVRSKIVIDNIVIEQVSHFRYLGWLTCEDDKIMAIKANRLQNT